MPHWPALAQATPPVYQSRPVPVNVVNRTSPTSSGSTHPIWVTSVRQDQDEQTDDAAFQRLQLGLKAGAGGSDATTTAKSHAPVSSRGAATAADPEQPDARSGRIDGRGHDFVMSTVSADLPWDDYLGIPRPQGRLCVVGLPERPITFTPLSLLPAAKTIVGGIVGSAMQTRQMIEFAARHDIRPHTFGQSPPGLRPGGEVNGRCELRRVGMSAPRWVDLRAGQDCRKASRSALIVSAWVVGMPCGNPG
jgi:hypothetical protein